MELDSRCWVVIPAAGCGSRLGAACPKQYLDIKGKSILSHTLDALLELNLDIEKVIVVVPEVDDPNWLQLGYGQDDRIVAVKGGATRAHSVFCGLQALLEQAEDNDWVMVHDAARPVLKKDMVDRLLAATYSNEVGALVGMPVNDTVKQVCFKGNVEKTHVREKIWLAQTPQVFRYGILYQALQRVLDAGDIVTDESSAVEAMGLQPKMVLGEAFNIKVTTWQDVERVKAYLGEGAIV